MTALRAVSIKGNTMSGLRLLPQILYEGSDENMITWTIC